MVNTVCLSYFSSPDGEVLVRCKGDTERPVPFGCYYDHGEVFERLKIRLENDFYPLIPFIQSSIENKFEISTDQVSWTAWIATYDFPQADYNSIVDLCKRYMTIYDPEYFDLYINIDCKKDGISFGAQIRILTDKTHWSDVDGEEEFLVWDFTVAGVTENIDELFSKEQILQIVDYILGELDRCFLDELNINRL